MRPLRRVEGLRRGVAGRQPPGARRRRADGGVRRGDRADQDRLRRGRHAGPATRPAWRARSPRSTTSPPAGSSAASARGGIRWRRKVGIDRDRPLTVMREVVDRACAPCSHNETVTLRRRPRAPRRRRARLRVPGATAQGRADLHRRDRHADDGADRRDRRRRGAQLPRRPRLQRAGDGGAGTRRGQGRTHASTTSTARSSSSARVDERSPATALDMARLMVTQYLGQQPHIMKASGVPQELLDEIGEVLTWPATHDAGRGRQPSWCPTRSCRCSPPRGDARRGRGPRSTSTSPTAAPARSSTRSARRRADDRHVHAVTRTVLVNERDREACCLL